MSASNTPPGLSIFFPAYNDSGTIASMVVSAVLAAGRLTPDFEILIINDGSRDATPQIADELARVYPQVRVIHHQGNRGYGGALRSGFASATREWIFYTDGDAQYDVRELEVLLRHAGPDVDIVQGYKIARGDPVYRRIVGRVYHWGVKIAFGLPYRDVDCDFRLIRRTVFDKVKLTRNSGMICVEMMTKLHRAGFRCVEAPVHHHQRAQGKSQFFNFPRIARTLWQLAGLWIQVVVLRREG
jgi:glycosyltransferase involved in cell wall biosynthesis